MTGRAHEATFLQQLFVSLYASGNRYAVMRIDQALFYIPGGNVLVIIVAPVHEVRALADAL